MKIYKKIISLLTIGVLSATMMVGCGKGTDSTTVLNVYNVGDYIDESLISKFEEETGIKDVKPISKDMYSLELINVNGHEKRGKYVGSHVHLNVTYLLEADEKEEIHIKEDENSAVKWVPIDKVLEASSEAWIRDRVYSKIIDKMKKDGIIKNI